MKQLITVVLVGLFATPALAQYYVETDYMVGGGIGFTVPVGNVALFRWSR